jgi:hypothetical protein
MARLGLISVVAVLLAASGAFAAGVWVDDSTDVINVWASDPYGQIITNLPEPSPADWINFNIDVYAWDLQAPIADQVVCARLMGAFDEPPTQVSDYLIGVARQGIPLLKLYFASNDPIHGLLPEGLPEGVTSINLDLPGVPETAGYLELFGYNNGAFTAPGTNDQLAFYALSPEPATLSLLALGGLALLRRRK